MNKEEVLKKIEEVFQKELKQKDLHLSMETTAKDVAGWDSMTHVILIVEIEIAFKKRFSSKDINSWKNVGDMVNSILN
jgi:acyl carrier protein